MLTLQIDFHHSGREGALLIPYPFITTCQMIGTSCDSGSALSFGMSVECFAFCHEGIRDNDGMTILDITDPTKINYCFSDYGRADGKHVLTPLSASTYFEFPL